MDKPRSTPQSASIGAGVESAYEITPVRVAERCLLVSCKASNLASKTQACTGGATPPTGAIRSTNG